MFSYAHGQEQRPEVVQNDSGTPISNTSASPDSYDPRRRKLRGCSACLRPQVRQVLSDPLGNSLELSGLRRAHDPPAEPLTWGLSYPQSQEMELYWALLHGTENTLSSVFSEQGRPKKKHWGGTEEEEGSGKAA